VKIRQEYRTWRNLHPHTVQFWGGINRSAINSVRKPGTTINYKQFTLNYDGTFLRIALPSGRSLSYPFPRLATDKFGNAMVVFKDNAAGKWTDCRFGQGAYGGLWIENIVQAVSRDLLAAAMLRLEAAGYPIVLHVHDEIVAEVPEGFGSVEEFRRLITALPAWADALPLAAKVRNGLRFAKTEDKPKATPGANNDEDAAGEDNCSDDPLPSRAWMTPSRSADNDAEDQPPSATETLSEASRAEFEAILAYRTAVRPPEPHGSEQGQQGSGQRHDQQHEEYVHSRTQQHEEHGRAGYPHGERDTGHQIAFFIYQHADGRPYLGVKKTSTKQFPQYHWTGSSWAKGAPQGPKIPYRLPELIKAPLDAWVLICAGEKDAATAAALGFAATTNPEGERKGAWVPELNAWFAGRKRVAVMEDNDATGRAHVLEVAEALRGIVPDIRIVTFHDLPEHGDLTDWKERGHGRDDLLAKVAATKPHRPKPRPSPIRQWDGEPVPELEYSVPDRYPLDNVGLFSGEGGQGKSSLVEQLCVAHPLAREWLGCTPRQGPAIYIECEDAENVLHWRVDTGLRTITFHKNQYGPASATCFVRYENGLFLPVEGMSMDAAERASKADELFVILLRKFALFSSVVGQIVRLLLLILRSLAGARQSAQGLRSQRRVERPRRAAWY
jgi:hypothetical protein